ncbi:MAG TPA: hemolysin family protein [Xanthobacteraceae bacterium]|nr:hemolysin family protein [Xanthobacteraceae bacterium]
MLFIEIATVLILIVVNGLLALSELAVVSARPGRLKVMVQQGVKGSRRALALAADPGRFLSTVQIGITLIGIIAGAFSGATLAGRLVDWLMTTHGISERVAEPLAYGSVVTLITYLSLIIGELVPKQIALRNPEKIACLAAPAMTILSRVASPLVSLLDLSGKLVLTLLGQRAVAASRVTDEEIKTLVAEAESAGVLEPEEREMITRVMRLADRPVAAVMTPRHEVDMIDLADNDDINRGRIIESAHSRLPVYEENADAVLGVVQAKDLLDRCLQNSPLNIRESVQRAPVVPDTMDTLDVVSLLKSSPVHIGLVHDEYGHFQGVVTSADILEAIVGEFRHEEGAIEPNVVRRPDGSYLVSGAMSADDLAEAFAIPLPEDRSYHTVAGLALSGFGKLPEVGESVRMYGWQFEVLDMDGRRIDKILLTRAVPRRQAKP